MSYLHFSSVICSESKVTFSCLLCHWSFAGVFDLLRSRCRPFGGDACFFFVFVFMNLFASSFKRMISAGTMLSVWFSVVFIQRGHIFQDTRCFFFWDGKTESNSAKKRSFVRRTQQTARNSTRSHVSSKQLSSDLEWDHPPIQCLGRGRQGSRERATTRNSQHPCPSSSPSKEWWALHYRDGLARRCRTNPRNSRPPDSTDRSSQSSQRPRDIAYTRPTRDISILYASLGEPCSITFHRRQQPT